MQSDLGWYIKNQKWISIVCVIILIIVFGNSYLQQQVILPEYGNKEMLLHFQLNISFEFCFCYLFPQVDEK